MKDKLGEASQILSFISFWILLSSVVWMVWAKGLRLSGRTNHHQPSVGKMNIIVVPTERLAWS